MGTTPNWAIPYPALTDPPNGASQMQSLAERVDTLFTGADGRLTILETRTDKNGGEVIATGATGQTLTSAVGNKLTFAGVAQTPVGITWNGTDTFTVLEDGVYAVYAQCRKNAAAAQDAMAVSGTSYSDATLLFPGASVTGYGDVFVAGSRWLTAGTQLCAYYYNGGSTSTAITSRRPFFSVWRTS